MGLFNKDNSRGARRGGNRYRARGGTRGWPCALF